jgi:hypothetical protein
MMVNGMDGRKNMWKQEFGHCICIKTKEAFIYGDNKSGSTITAKTRRMNIDCKNKWLIQLFFKGKMSGILK